MGRGRITGGGTGGLYMLQRTYHDEHVKRELSLLEATLSELQQQRAEALQKHGEAQEAAELAREAYDDRVELYVQALVALDPESTPEEVAAAQEAVTAAQVALVRARSALGQAASVLSLVDARIDTATERRSQLRRHLNPPAESAWCADFTENASGSVATIEVPGEPARLLVYPQSLGEGAHNAQRDGMLLPREWASPEQAFFNASILPGWQRFMPTYRTGRIVALDADTCTVRLDDDRSSAQGLGINQQAVLGGVPIVYMTCNGAAFALSDHVVVEFVGRDWAQPRVIGFASSPRPCPANDRAFLVYVLTTESRSLQCWNYYFIPPSNTILLPYYFTDPTKHTSPDRYLNTSTQQTEPRPDLNGDGNETTVVGQIYPPTSGGETPQPQNSTVTFDQARTGQARYPNGFDRVTYTLPISGGTDRTWQVPIADAPVFTVPAHGGEPERSYAPVAYTGDSQFTGVFGGWIIAVIGEPIEPPDP